MIDSHAHLSGSALFAKASLLIEKAREQGVTKIINICTDPLSLQEGLFLASSHQGIYNTAATTPHDVEAEGERFFPIVEAHLDSLVAIGETGLDYFYEHSPKALQQHFLLQYVALAIKSTKPLIFHCREAFDDLLTLTDSYQGGAILHCFTGTLPEAKKVLDRGWLISFSGIVTFKKSIDLQAVAAYVPLEQMLIETDAPYLAPQSQRGKQNEPAFLPEIAQMIAHLKKIDPSQIAAQTTHNAEKIFGIS